MASDDAVADTRLQQFGGNDAVNARLSTSRHTNFPLPRELRDKIFGYLLCHEWVEGPAYSQRPLRQRSKYCIENGRDQSHAPTYHFDPAILAVNAEVHREAGKVLHANHFAVVTHQFPFINTAKHTQDLPIVSEDQAQVPKFKKHVVRMHMLAPRWLLDDIKDHGPDKRAETPKSFLMLGSHLPELCRILQYLFYCLQSSSPLVTRHDGMAPGGRGIVKLPEDYPGAIITKVQFLFPTTQSSLSQVHKVFMASLNDVIHGDHKISVQAPNGIPDFDIQTLKKRVGPAYIWPKAMAWHMLDLVLEMKRKGDKHLLEGNERAAFKQYDLIWSLNEACILFHTSQEVYSSDAAPPIGLLCRILFDAATTYSVLSLRFGRPIDQLNDLLQNGLSALTMVMARLPEAVRRVVVHSDQPPLVHLGVTWISALCLFLGERTRESLGQSVDIFERLAKEDPNDKRIAFDYALVRRTASDRMLRLGYLREFPVENFVMETAACRFPVQVFGSTEINDFSKPDGLEGWVDTVHLENIRRADPQEAAMLGG